MFGSIHYIDIAKFDMLFSGLMITDNSLVFFLSQHTRPI